MQREDVERDDWETTYRYCQKQWDEERSVLLDKLVLERNRAERAEAERDAAFAAGLQSAVAICKRVRSEEAENDDQAVGALECAIAIMDGVNALPIKPRP